MSRVSRPLLGLVLLGPTVFFLTLVTVIYTCVRIEAPTRLDGPSRQLVITALRAGFEGNEPVATSPLDEFPGGPIVVVVWVEGRELGRVTATGPSLGEAVREAARLLAPVGKSLSRISRERSRLSVDRVDGRAPLVRSLPVLSLFALHPGIDGVRATAPDGREAFLLPLDLHRFELLTAAKPLKFIPDLKMGVDLVGLEALAATRLGLTPSQWQRGDVELTRFRTDSFVEAPPAERDREPVALHRGIPARPALSSSALREAALAGGRFLVAHLAESGRYIYEVELATGRGTNPRKRRPYSLPRHAGTTYYLAELFRLTGDETFREPVERAFAHLGELVAEGGCEGTLENGKPFACVVDAGAKVTTLGGTALTVVALVEYKRATGSSTYDDLTKRLLEWILYMQRPDGSFAHRYNVAERTVDEDVQLLYFSGEAALALARAYDVYRDPRTLEATRRALDDLIGWYDFFVGGLFYGEEHWTCIAAEAAWPHIKDDRYRRFCDGYGAFLRLQQPELSDFPGSPDLAGTYGFTPFIIGANTPAGSRTEAMISAYLLGVYHGKPSAALRRQILAASHFALGQQVTADSAFWMPRRGAPVGGIPASPVEPSVRIDYVQHVCSALLRASVLLEMDRPKSANGASL